MAEESVREILDAKFVDNVDAPQATIGTPEVPEAPTAPLGEPSAPVTAPAEAPVTPSAPEKPVTPTPEKPVVPPVEPKQPAETPSAAPTTALNAPQAWRPETRELFKSLPVSVQQEIHRRERDVARYVQETSEIRQLHNSFIDTCRPYSQLIALDGGDPLKTFGEYLKTGAVLRLGTPHEKATAIAQAVRQFDININALDGALAQLYGGQVPQQQVQQPQQFKDPRLDELLSTIETTRAQRDQQMERSQLQEIESFRADPKHEFFEDLRGDISDLLEINARRGVRMTLPEAYDRALSMNPSVSKIVSQRRAQEAADKQKQLIAQKRQASTNAPGAPIPATNGAGDRPLRATLEAAFDAHQQPV